jgi:hypothetical protein
MTNINAVKLEMAVHSSRNVATATRISTIARTTTDDTPIYLPLLSLMNRILKKWVSVEDALGKVLKPIVPLGGPVIKAVIDELLTVEI